MQFWIIIIYLQLCIPPSKLSSGRKHSWRQHFSRIQYDNMFTWVLIYWGKFFSKLHSLHCNFCIYFYYFSYSYAFLQANSLQVENTAEDNILVGLNIIICLPEFWFIEANILLNFIACIAIFVYIYYFSYSYVFLQAYCLQVESTAEDNILVG